MTKLEMKAIDEQINYLEAQARKGNHGRYQFSRRDLRQPAGAGAAKENAVAVPVPMRQESESADLAAEAETKKRLRIVPVQPASAQPVAAGAFGISSSPVHEPRRDFPYLLPMCNPLASRP